MKIQGVDQTLVNAGGSQLSRIKQDGVVRTEEGVPYGGGPSAEITISKEGFSRYQNNIQSDSWEKMMAERERKLPVYDGFYEHSQMLWEYEKRSDAVLKREGRYDIANVARTQHEAYANAYQAIKQGYRDGTREIWVADGDGTIRKRTEEEDLQLLDQAYKIEMAGFDAFVRILEDNEWMKKYGAETCGAPDEKVKDFHKALMDSMEKAQAEFIKQYSYKDSKEANVKKAGSIAAFALKENSELWNRMLELSAFIRIV